MKSKIFITITFLLVVVASAFAQTEEAVKVDEFENPMCEDYLARMDSFQVQLHNVPNSKGYILIYEGKLTARKKGKTYYVSPHVGEAKSYKQTIIRRLALRGFDKEKIVFVEAGFREHLTLEFWIVPIGAEPPEARPTLKKIKYQKGKTINFCPSELG